MPICLLSTRNKNKDGGKECVCSINISDFPSDFNRVLTEKEKGCSNLPTRCPLQLLHKIITHFMITFSFLTPCQRNVSFYRANHNFGGIEQTALSPYGYSMLL